MRLHPLAARLGPCLAPVAGAESASGGTGNNRDPHAVADWLGRHAPGARLVTDSRQVRPGDVFMAWPGRRADARLHADAAVRSGACAIVFEAGVELRLPQPVPSLAVTGLAQQAGEIASLHYGEPSAAMWCVGVTGTNGKTSTTQWLARALQAEGMRCGLIGTLGNGFPDALAASGLTTPDAVGLQTALRDLHEQGAQAMAMEVSSIGLDQNRVGGVAFDVAAFTNLTRDHLDYHGDMERYEASKARLFGWPGLSVAVINLDDPAGLRMLARARDAGVPQRIGYGLSGPHDTTAAERDDCTDHLLALNAEAHAAGTGFDLLLDGQAHPVRTRLVGRFNIENCLLVAGVLRAAHWPVERIVKALQAIEAAPGRMQVVSDLTRPAGEAVPAIATVDVTAQSAVPLVVVDYAHTPDALQQALAALRPVAQARGGALWCVFGCGGDRDPGKRPLMGAAAAAGADRVVVTSDNPRSESPQAIIEQIRSGLGSQQHAVEVDRSHAVEQAIMQAHSSDVLLVAGKGHEDYQEIAGVKHPYSDIVTSRAALARRLVRTGAGS